MGTIIQFPKDAAARRERRTCEGPATVVILPAIRIERHDDAAGMPEPQRGASTGRHKRRRARS
jgi:hypothetical protein